MTRFLALLGLAFSLTLSAPAQAALGDTDCSFGNNGVLTIPGSFGRLFSVAAEPGGSTLLRMGFTSTGSNLYRTDANGTTTVDLGSTINRGLVDPADVVLADGKILFSNGQGNSFAAPPIPAGVVRFLAAGGLDTTFGTNGVATVAGLTQALSGPVVQPDGRILVAARVSDVASIVRFNADGSPDATFGTGGVASNASAGPYYESIALQADGKIVAIGLLQLSRHTATGALDTTFGPSANGNVNLTSLFGPAIQVRVQPSGKILVAGPNNLMAALRIARFGTDGTLDTSVGGGTGYRDPPVTSPSIPWIPLYMMSDGRPVLSGGAGDGGAIVRYTVDLADDATISLPYPVNMTSVVPSGKLIVSNGDSGRHGSTAQNWRLLGDADAATCVTTTTTMTSNPNPSNFSQTVTLTANVLHTPPPAGTPSGSVQFKRNGVNIGTPAAVSGGIATATTTTLPEGTSSLTAVFFGSGVFAGSTSAPVSHVVNQRPASMTTVSTSPNPSVFGQPVSVQVTVAPASGPGTPTGTVTVTRIGSGMSSERTLSNGAATFVMNSLPHGTHTFRATYNGDNSFAPSTSPDASHTVNAGISINDPTANSANGPTTMTFQVSLSAAQGSTVTVNYATSDRTAVAGVDYTATSGVVTFAPGQTQQPVVVNILGQTTPGPAKDFFLTLTNATGAGIGKGAGIGTIVYSSSGALSIYIDDPSVAEGASGVTLIGFNVSLTAPSSQTVSVDFATANGTAVAGTDYTGRTGSLTFVPGQTQRWVVVALNGDTVATSNRSFFLNLSNATNAVIGKVQGTGTIIDDDPTPAATTIPQYRLYHNGTKEHLYTTDFNEYNVLGTAGWVQEGTAYTMFGTGGTHGGQIAIPLYRMYHWGILQHHWTTDANEVLVLSGYGSWNYEGIAGYVLPVAVAGTTPLFRLMYVNPPLHLWTTDANERTVLTTQQGWVDEGIVGEVLP